MIIDEIIELLSFPVKETRFIKPPSATYGVYDADREYRGCDCELRLCESDITFYIVEYIPSPDIEKEFEQLLIKRGIEFQKTARIWIESEKIYQISYAFKTLEKMRTEE